MCSLRRIFCRVKKGNSQYAPQKDTFVKNSKNSVRHCAVFPIILSKTHRIAGTTDRCQSFDFV